MFCPVCKAEYRLGFTHCSDCDVDLVEHLDPERPGARRGDNAELAFLLWTGTDTQAQRAICDALDHAKIVHHLRSREAGIRPLPSPVCAVFVHRRDREAAEAVLDDIRHRVDLGDSESYEEANASPAAELIREDESDEGGPAPDDMLREFLPSEASAQVWSGDDREMLDTVEMCLRENGIGCVVDTDGAKFAVRVSPGSEDRAREIIREIVEGVPPA
jgi:hypothetical protein